MQRATIGDDQHLYAKPVERGQIIFEVLHGIERDPMFLEEAMHFKTRCIAEESPDLFYRQHTCLIIGQHKTLQDMTRDILPLLLQAPGYIVG